MALRPELRRLGFASTKTYSTYSDFSKVETAKFFGGVGGARLPVQPAVIARRPKADAAIQEMKRDALRSLDCFASLAMPIPALPDHREAQPAAP